MNKLEQWLRRVAGGEGPRMGFGASGPRVRGPGLGLLATLPELSRKLASEALEAGAEALVIPAGLALPKEGLAADPKGLRSITGGFPQCLWGLELDSGQAPGPDLGFDFLLLSPSSALSALRGEGWGRLLAVDPTWEDGRLRSLEPLPVDGVLFPLAPKGGDYTQIEHLLTVRRLASLVRKPLLIELGQSLSGEDLGTLRDGGLSGLLVAGPADQWLATIKSLRRTLEALPPRSRARREVDVILPFAPGGRAAPPEEEEEET